MENSRLWQVIISLNAAERKHLNQWLQSPFFCRRAQPLGLFTYFRSCVESGSLPVQEAAQGAVFGAEKSADVQALRAVMTELMGHIEHFLIYSEKFDRKGDYHIRLAEAYRKRGLEKHFRQSLHAARSDWASQPYRHAEYFDAQMAIELELYQHQSAGQRTQALNWQELSNQTDTAFIARKLRQACFALSHQMVYSTGYNFGLLDMVLAHMRGSEALQAIPSVGLYYFCYLFLTEAEGEPFFREFKPRLLANLGQLPVDEQRNLHLLALNFCIRKINQSVPDYFREALDLYKSALNAELLLENGQLSHFAYSNIAAIAIKVGDTEWVEQFIHQYAPFLEKKHREAASHLNLARLEYSRQNMGAALQHLQQADYKDLINNLIAKTLQLKIYYETGEYDALDAHLQSMQTFIRRQRVIGYHKTNYQNIVRFGRRLLQLNPNSREDRQAMRQQIASEPVLTEREWFLEMLK
ncbi:MAG: hypothetical protein KA138_02060 [Saprospiraceae bacterium]|nr:hypothetical protein [Saprospiraceae bacterium]